MKKQRNEISWLRAHPIWIVLGILLIVGILWPQPSISQRAQAAGSGVTQEAESVDSSSAANVDADATVPPDSAQSEAATDTPQSAPAQEAQPQDDADGLWFDAADSRGAKSYTDEELVYWNAGTFDSRQDSLRYHFNKHGEELPADTVADYLNQAYETRAEVLEDSDGWRVTESQGANAAHKYKNYDDSRFIILDDDDNTIYSFGR